jgi:hypothetical protein
MKLDQLTPRQGLTVAHRPQLPRLDTSLPSAQDPNAALVFGGLAKHSDVGFGVASGWA